MGAPMKAESPWHMVTRPNDEVSFSIPNNSATITDRYDTNTAADGQTWTVEYTGAHNLHVPWVIIINNIQMR